ncbi:hypothetical protein FALBO_3364 [Fusarium albosuccineum]|uniref:Uncharacterized protein n=1 Tax=Fusarium albosuccineum TaxID=1237068 RepID=A0A8H4LKA9_9HYPO|nr:hypothetical protein FALBO_3364 [Fusarium albosuccineum]
MRPGQQVITLQLCDDFLKSVFDNWTSENSCNPLPVLAQRKFTETSITVGTLKQDAPITPRKRKQGDTVQTNLARVQGAPVKLSVYLNLGEGTFGLLWRDRRSATINPGNVRFDEEMTRELAIEKAILHWDANESRRITTHNSHVIVALARSRIVDFAEAGTARLPFIREDFLINNRIVRLELASDGIADYGACLVRIAEKCRAGGQLPNRI